MANAPELWYQVIFQPGVVNKLSLIPPYNECTVDFSCNQHIKVFRAWSIFGIYDGTQKGRKIVEYTNRDANVQISFNINAENHMKHGEGTYTILFYVENDEGLSNMYSYLMSTEQDSSNLYLYEINNLKLKAIDIAGEPEEEQDNDYLCFTSQQNGSSIGYNIVGSGLNININYSYDSKNWTSWDGSTITLNNGEKIYVWNKTNTLSTSASNYLKFTMSGSISASGNVDSMINFSELTPYCYYALFSNCTRLTIAPYLPATNLAEHCYERMFVSCTSLTTAPDLPATNLADYCYRSMFKDCIGLNSIKLLYTGNFDSCFYLWVANVGSSGTLYYNGSDTTRGVSAIPVGWDVQTFTP